MFWIASFMYQIYITIVPIISSSPLFEGTISLSIDKKMVVPHFAMEISMMYSILTRIPELAFTKNSLYSESICCICLSKALTASLTFIAFFEENTISVHLQSTLCCINTKESRGNDISSPVDTLSAYTLMSPEFSV